MMHTVNKAHKMTEKLERFSKPDRQKKNSTSGFIVVLHLSKQVHSSSFSCLRFAETESKLLA